MFHIKMVGNRLHSFQVIQLILKLYCLELKKYVICKTLSKLLGINQNECIVICSRIIHYSRIIPWSIEYNKIHYAVCGDSSKSKP